MTQPTTIRERDADARPFKWANPGDDQTELDRRTLLAALDALVEAAEEFPGYVDYGRLRKGGREAQARLAAAIAAAKEASDD